MRGQLIVFEGINGSGKTSQMHEVMKEFPNSIYCKGVGDPNTLWGRIARKIPSTLTFLLDLIITKWLIVRPAIKNEKTVFHDRYWYSIMVYKTAQYWHNQLIGKLLCRLLLKPDWIILVEVDIDESVNRLLKKEPSKFDFQYITNPAMIVEEKKLFRKLINHDLILDTTKLNLESCVQQILMLLGRRDRCKKKAR